MTVDPAPSSPVARRHAVATVRGLGHRFDGVQALEAIDGTFYGGEIAVLLGANGSGKTTLLRCLAGQLTPSSGQVQLPGDDRVSQRQRRRHIAYLPQRSALDPEMTVRESLRFLAILQGIARHQRGRRVDELAATFGLQPLLPRRVDQLSGGQRRRLHLAVGLLPQAELLLLDEPDAGLDREGQQALWQTLRQRAQQGTAVVAVTHHTAMAERHAQVAWLLAAGRLLDHGTSREIIARHGLLSSGSLSEDDPSNTGQDGPRGGGRRPGNAGRRHGGR